MIAWLQRHGQRLPWAVLALGTLLDLLVLHWAQPGSGLSNGLQR